jgi:DNA-binding NarL/FixJ family response regulator
MNVRSCGSEDVLDAERFLAAAESPARPLSVLIVSEHDVVRAGFRLMLAQVPWMKRCVGARTAQEALLAWNRYEPKVAVIDLFVDGVAGADISRTLRQARPQGRVLLTSLSERMSSAAVAAAGASGFISTGAPAADMAEAIRAAGSGEMLAPAPRRTFGVLSSRQREVLGLMAAGATNRQIADALCLSPHTVKGHTTDLYKRLRARNRAEAVNRAQSVGLLA